MKDKTYLALIEVNGKEVRCAYDPKKRKAYMLNEKGETLQWFTYSKFKFIGYLESSKEGETKTFVK